MKYWFSRSRGTAYFSYSDALGETYYYRVLDKDTLVKCEAPSDVYDVRELQLGIVPKEVRAAAFMNLYGSAWLDSLTKKNRLILSPRKTIELAVFVLGRPIRDAYALPDIVHDDGRIECRWKANGEMIQQFIVDGEPGELFCSKLSYARERITRDEWFVCRDYRPNDIYYGAEHEGEMYWWRVRDSGNQRYIDECEMPASLFTPISTFDVPISVRALLFTRQHSDVWLKAIRESGKFSNLTDGQLIIRAYVKGRPIWPWDEE